MKGKFTIYSHHLGTWYSIDFGGKPVASCEYECGDDLDRRKVEMGIFDRWLLYLGKPTDGEFSRNGVVFKFSPTTIIN